MNEHKDDIISTRKGCLGGSDAELIQRIAIANKIPQSAMKRLAICKGLIEPQQFTNNAIEFGNYIEAMVFDSLHSLDGRWQSNPCLVSTKYSRTNCKVIDHIDLYLQDDENKVLTIGEVKATKNSYIQTYHEYKLQLLHHCLLGCEKAKELGGYRVKVMLCHYCTNGIDLTQPFEFDTSRLTVKTLRGVENLSKSYHLSEAMDIVDEFMEGFDSYYEGDEVDADMLPQQVRTQFDEVATFLKEIKEREAKVEEFKRKLYSFMVEKEIKSIKCDAFGITRVDETKTKSFDAKRFLEDFKQKHPRKAEKVIAEFSKETKKKGYCLIKINNNKDVEDIFK